MGKNSENCLYLPIKQDLFTDCLFFLTLSPNETWTTNATMYLSEQSKALVMMHLSAIILAEIY